MELDKNRVWDYVGDNFVHRLVQTDGSDGKLVEAEGRCMDNCKNDGVTSDEKIDSIQLEYTYLLTSQLESQRRYFEEKISRVESDAHREIEEVMNRARTSVEESAQMKTQVLNLDKDKSKAEKRQTEMLTRLTKTMRQLEEE